MRFILGKKQILSLVVLVAGALSVKSSAQDLEFSNSPQSYRFAVIGDSGTGGKRQQQIANQMVGLWQRYPFYSVLMLGDNLYGSEKPRDYYKKFERPYEGLLKSGVKFYAVLGNHDKAAQRVYPGFNMGGERYYATTLTPYLRAIGLDTTAMDGEQIHWLENELSRKHNGWTIVFMHHPLYSSGKRHGPSLQMRAVLEPLFMKYGVDVVFSGHEHFYERLNPQNGIHYFVSGAAGKLRRSNIRETEARGCGYDQDNSFMLLQATEDSLEFATIGRDGRIVDKGTVRRQAGNNSVLATCMAQH